MFNYTLTYSTPDYDRQPSYTCSLSWECAYNAEQPILNNIKGNNEDKKTAMGIH